MSGRFKDITWYDILFNEVFVTKCVAGITNAEVLAVSCTRETNYFDAVVETQQNSVKKRYSASYV